MGIALVYFYAFSTRLGYKLGEREVIFLLLTDNIITYNIITYAGI